MKLLFLLVSYKKIEQFSSEFNIFRFLIKENLTKATNVFIIYLLPFVVVVFLFYLTPNNFYLISISIDLQMLVTLISLRFVPDRFEHCNNHTKNRYSDFPSHVI